MSTNFYFKMEFPEDKNGEIIRPKVRLTSGEEIPYIMPEPHCQETHIGKRVAVAGGVGFIWAVTPYYVYKKLVSACFDRYGNPDWIIAEDEYGKQYTAEEFRIILDECKLWKLHAIGTDFC